MISVLWMKNDGGMDEDQDGNCKDGERGEIGRFEPTGLTYGLIEFEQ